MHRHLEAQMQRLFLATAAAAVMAGVGSARAAETVQIDGSSTVFPVTEAVAEEFQKAKGSRSASRSASPAPAAASRSSAAARPTSPNASRPILKEEIEACKAAGISFIELPIAYRRPDRGRQPAERLPRAA